MSGACITVQLRHWAKLVTLVWAILSVQSSCWMQSHHTLILLWCMQAHLLFSAGDLRKHDVFHNTPWHWQANISQLAGALYEVCNNTIGMRQLIAVPNCCYVVNESYALARILTLAQTAKVDATERLCMLQAVVQLTLLMHTLLFCM